MINQKSTCRRNNEDLPENESQRLTYDKFISNQKKYLARYLDELNVQGNAIYECCKRIYRKRFPEMEFMIPEKQIYVQAIFLLEDHFRRIIQDRRMISETLDLATVENVVNIVKNNLIGAPELSEEEKRYLLEVRTIINASTLAYSISKRFLCTYLQPDNDHDFFKYELQFIERQGFREIFPSMNDMISELTPNHEQVELFDCSSIRNILIFIGISIEHLMAQKELFIFQLPPEQQLPPMLMHTINMWIDEYFDELTKKMSYIKKDLEEKIHLSDDQFLELYNHHYMQLIVTDLADLQTIFCNKFGIKSYITYCASNAKSLCCTQSEFQELWFKEVFLKYEERFVYATVSSLYELRERKEENANLFNSISLTYAGAHKVDETYLHPPYVNLLQIYVDVIKDYHEENFFSKMNINLEYNYVIYSEIAKKLYEEELNYAKKFFYVDERYLMVREFAFKILIQPFNQIFFDRYRTALVEKNTSEIENIIKLYFMPEDSQRLRRIFMEVILNTRRRFFDDEEEAERKSSLRDFLIHLIEINRKDSKFYTAIDYEILLYPLFPIYRKTHSAYPFNC